METNLQALKVEAFEREKESIELRIKRCELELKLKKEILSKEKDKDEIEYLRNEIENLDISITEYTDELNNLQGLTAEQYIERESTRTVEDCKESIEYYTERLDEKEIEEWAIQYSTERVRDEIRDLIDDNKIKAPKSYEKQEKFIEELLKTPEYQSKISAMIKKSAEEYKQDLLVKINQAQQMMNATDPNSEEFIKGIIENLKADGAHQKARICELDIVELFKLGSKRKDIRREEEFSEEGNVVEVIAQIPPEEYMAKVRPILEARAKVALEKFGAANNKRVLQKVGLAVASVLNYFGGSTAITMAGAGLGYGIAALAGADPGAGMGIGAAVGMASGVAGTIYGNSKIGKYFDKIDDKFVEYDKIIEEEIKKVLIELGYMKEDESAKGQPEQE